MFYLKSVVKSTLSLDIIPFVILSSIQLDLTLFPIYFITISVCQDFLVAKVCVLVHYT